MWSALASSLQAWAKSAILACICGIAPLHVTYQIDIWFEYIRSDDNWSGDVLRIEFASRTSKIVLPQNCRLVINALATQHWKGCTSTQCPMHLHVALAVWVLWRFSLAPQTSTSQCRSSRKVVAFKKFLVRFPCWVIALLCKSRRSVAGVLWHPLRSAKAYVLLMLSLVVELRH